METIKAPQRKSGLSVKLDTGIQFRLKSLAKAQRRTTHFIMCEAITKYVVEQEAEQRFVDVAMQSVDHYQKTGLHVTQKEFDAWVNALDSNMNAPVPACHA